MKRREFLRLAGATLILVPKISFAQADSSKPLRIVVVANRYHEADGLMAAVCNQLARNPLLSVPYNVDWPRVQSNPPVDSQKPRCLIDVFKNRLDKVPSATMEIWCIDDLATTYGVSSAKVIAMDKITNYGGAPDGIVAFGTAGYPGLPSNNGCAAIGGTIFIRDASNDASGTHDNWSWPSHMGILIPSKTPVSFFSSVLADQEMLYAINAEMISPQNRPSGTLQLIIAADAVGISSVDVPATNPPIPYCDTDTKAIADARAAGASNIASVETTHGVIRSKWPDAPFIFVTAIPNRVCHFPDEAQNMYAQEFPSSHNAGVALKHVMPYFVGAIGP
jgi:hypothetical protein